MSRRSTLKRRRERKRRKRQEQRKKALQSPLIRTISTAALIEELSRRTHILSSVLEEQS